MNVRTAMDRLAAWARGLRPALPRLGLLALLLIVLGALKFAYTPARYHTDLDPWPDGGYYTEIARHVRNGHGLRTNVSLMHKGYLDFPHRTSVQPLWPLVLGYAARAMPLDRAAVLLPVLFYALCLIFAYLFGRKLSPAPLFPERFPAFDSGHVLALIVGLHAGFFRATSMPMSEGLAYALLFGGLWLGVDAWAKPSFGRGLAVGLWAALTFLARGQLLVLAAAAFATSLFLIAFGDRRRPQALMLGGMVVGFVPLLAWDYAFIRGFVIDATPLSLLRFDQNRASEVLSRVPVLVQTGGVMEYLQDRAQGFVEAYEREGRHSFALGFYVFQYALPVALPFALLGAILSLRKGGLGRAIAYLRTAESARWVFVVALAFAGYLSLHMIHKATWTAWNFGQRQAIACALLFFLAHLFLLRSKLLLAPALAIFLLCNGAFAGFQQLYGVASAAYGKRIPDGPANRSLAGFLRWKRRTTGELTVAMHLPQKQALYTHDVGFHAVMRTATSVNDLRRMVDALGVRYVILPTQPRGWRLLAEGSAFYASFKVKRTLGSLTVWAPRWVADDPDPSDEPARGRK